MRAALERLAQPVTRAPLTLGTAGHIDHGKTALIRALTGVDTDRLPEERARGISIALGYAKLTLPSARELSVIDVPGHERFVRTMVAGATGIDMYLMTVAADDGVMPQTREHAAVLHALGVGAGVVAVTKSDLADPELAMIEASELLPGAELVAVSARTGEGLDELRAALDRVAAQLRSRAADEGGRARLHIDRVFTIRGAGTVVTGTLWSGSIGAGDEVVVLPSGLRARVRGVQVHDAAVERAVAGQRVAVNLTGVAVEEVERGEVLSIRGLGPARHVPDRRRSCRSRTDEPEHGARVQVHHGTRESPARLAWLGGPFWQIRLEQQLVPSRGDRLVIRQIAPPDTIGGGTVLDATPAQARPFTGVAGPARAAGARRERRRPTRRPAPGSAAPRETPPEPQPLTPSALALEQRLREAAVRAPARLRARRRRPRRAARRRPRRSCLEDAALPPGRARRGPRARGGAGRAPRRRGDAGPATRRAWDLAQVRAGAARASRFGAGHDPPRRGPPRAAHYHVTVSSRASRKPLKTAWL